MLKIVLKNLFVIKNYKTWGKNFSSDESGFTLMELLIVLALVAVISMIAVPIYRGYVQGAKITEGLTLAGGIQLDAEVFYAMNNRWPSEADTHAELKLGEPTEYRGNSVESITIRGNVITVLYNDEVVGENGEEVQLILTGDSNGGVIRWQCEGVNLQEDDLPNGCEIR
ncbi:pilin [Ignatzschineria sp. LJL83]